MTADREPTEGEVRRRKLRDAVVEKYGTGEWIRKRPQHIVKWLQETKRLADAKKRRGRPSVHILRKTAADEELDAGLDVTLERDRD